jgi:hypothetical protein
MPLGGPTDLTAFIAIADQLSFRAAVPRLDTGVRLLNKPRPAMDQIAGLVPAVGTGDTFSQPRRGSRVNCRTEQGWVPI